jgi:hypothetical protein
MVFRKKESEYIDKEKDIYNYLRKANRLFLLLSALEVRKEKYFNELRNIKIIKTANKAVIALQENLRKNILKAIKRQQRFLLQDMAVSNKEEVLIEQIQKIPLFSELNQEEANILKKIVSWQKEEIQKLVVALNQYSSCLKNQESIMIKIKFEFDKEINSDLAEFDKLIIWEKESIPWFIELVKKLEAEILENKNKYLTLESEQELIKKEDEIGKLAEAFFKNIEIIYFSNKQDFLDMMKLKYPHDSVEDILQKKGANLVLRVEGKIRFFILIRTDPEGGYPEKYIPYIETHEKWEMCIRYKKGFKLLAKIIRVYQKDKNIVLKQNNQKRFQKALSEYNYEFSHEYAIYKEYQHAQRDGKLDEYHNWFMSSRPAEIEHNKKIRNLHNLRLIENDTIIRNSIYKKLTQGSKHYFLRK